MVLILSVSECPRCHGEVFEQFKSKTGHRKGSCENCDYEYSKKQKVTAVMEEFELTEENSYSIACLAKKDGSSQVHLFESDRELDSRQFEKFQIDLMMLEDIDPKNSYFAMQHESVFYVFYGQAPDNFIEIYIENLKLYKPLLEAELTKG